MAYLATKRFNYRSQLGILTAFTGVGLVIGGLASLIPFLGKIKPENIFSPLLLNYLLKPENATALRWMNSIANFFLFFLRINNVEFL